MVAPSGMIRPATPEDIGVLAQMRHELWPDGSVEEHRWELEAFFDRGWTLPTAVYVAVGSNDRIEGFCEVSIRPHAEGCVTDRVGYLEGWYVVPDARRRGVGCALGSAAEAWARSHGCREMASDTEADNQGSAAAHAALGFEEVGLVRCFRKDL